MANELLLAAGPSETPVQTALGGNGEEQKQQDDMYLPIETLRRQYLDFLSAKQDEIKERRISEQYYHGAQWTSKELKALKKRKQPVITSNRIARKIDAVVGLIERLRQDPKAFARTPQHEEGAEIATASVRYILDRGNWKGKSPECARDGAIGGIGGLEYALEQGDHGDPDINFHIVDPDTFFYDPRSFQRNFSDARYLGVAKWADVEQVGELVPAKADIVDDLLNNGSDMTANPDREKNWINTNQKKLLLIDHWYVCKGQWCWALYVASEKLAEGVSPFTDEKNKSFPRYRMFSATVDHDGDRYGFVRNMKSSQDEINHRRSKALHQMNSRRLIIDAGAVDDVERTRTEWGRPDGVVVKNPGLEVKQDDQSGDIRGQLELLQESKNEIENFGPNPALVGQGLEDSSGRAISLLQQAGIAELGPYITGYKEWKIAVYRDLFNIARKSWTSERYIRVTDDQNLAQFIKINGLGLDENMQPVLENHLGSLDVDIIMDEGPDSVNMAADAYDTLAKSGAQIPPDIMIELNPYIQDSIKQNILKRMRTPDPQTEDAKATELAGNKAKVVETHTKSIGNIALAYANAAKANQPVPPQDGWAAADSLTPSAAPPMQPQQQPGQMAQPLQPSPEQQQQVPMPGPVEPGLLA